MARLTGPTQAQRVFYYSSGPLKGRVVPNGTPLPLYADNQCSLPADVLSLDGGALAVDGEIPQVLIGDTLEAPRILFPDVPDPVVYTRVLGGPVIALHPDPDSRLDSFYELLPADAPATTAAAGSALTLPDQRDAALYVVTLTAASCALTFPTATPGRSFTLLLKQDSASRMVTWPAGVKWPADTPPTLQTAAGAVDEVSFRHDGSVWRGAYVAGYSS